MADINRLMQIINALEAQGMDVEGMLGSMLTPVPMPSPMPGDTGMQPVPMPTPMKRDTGMEPVPMGRPLTQEEMLMEIRRRMQGMTPSPGMGTLSQGEMDMIMDRMPRMQPGPGMGSISQGEMDMLRRRAMPRSNNAGILNLLQQMR